MTDAQLLRRALTTFKRSIASKHATRASYVQVNPDANIGATSARAEQRLNEVRELLRLATQPSGTPLPPSQTEPVPYIIAHTSYTAEQLWKDARRGYLNVYVWSATTQAWVSVVTCLDNLRQQLQRVVITFNGVQMVITYEDARSLTVAGLCARIEQRFALALTPDDESTWSFVLSDSVPREAGVINTRAACERERDWWTQCIDPRTYDFGVCSTYTVTPLSTLGGAALAHEMQLTGNRQQYADALATRAQQVRDRQLREEQDAAFVASQAADRERAHTAASVSAPDVEPDAPTLHPTPEELRAIRMQRFAPS